MALPLWKIRRELVRFARQIPELPENLYNLLFATRRYDRQLASQVRRYDGALQGASRVAIFVIFPSSGLLPSHLHTLSYFRSKGYAVQVVSNLPLPDADRERLLEQCWRFVERPNFGYDFGAYREGILDLADELAGLERLVLINDSTWFPLPGSRDWLDDVEALDVDFAGAASHYGAPRPEIERFRSIRWAYGPHHRNFHYASFALCLRPGILRSADFIAYWRTFHLTDKKRRTVRRGEVGLTQWMLSHGFSHNSTMDLTRLDEDLAELGVPRLLEIAEDMIIPELLHLKELKATITTQPNPDKSDLIKFILLSVARQGASYALASYATRE
ncbi:MAG: hypothetical protein KGH84_07720, partial [Paracoccaceae bacterium]|nr:hypothetical protein [Paracoccaceae bacterium]